MWREPFGGLESKRVNEKAETLLIYFEPWEWLKSSLFPKLVCILSHTLQSTREQRSINT